MRHGSLWHYEVDGSDHVISESSTPTPTAPVPDSVFLPESALPNPLTFTWSATKGADLNWVPIPFASTFTLSYGRTHYGSGYFIHQSFPEGADDLYGPITAWNEAPPAPDVLELLRSAGNDIGPTGENVASETGASDVPTNATAGHPTGAVNAAAAATPAPAWSEFRYAVYSWVLPRSP